MTRTIALTMMLMAAVAAGGEDVKQPGTDSSLKPAETQPLVDAAKTAKAQRKKSSGKVITNADVKKSKGKLIVIEGSEPKVATEAKKELTLGELEALRDKRYAAEDRLAKAEKSVEALEKEVERLEQRYYEENDPNYRDEVIEKRFTQAKRQLDEALLELANARDDLRKVEEPVP